MKKDYKKFANKVFGSIIPEEYPFIQKVEVINCEVHEDEWVLDDFVIPQDELFLDILFYIDKKPLIELGLDKKEKLTNDEFELVYGKNLIDNLRSLINRLLSHMGIKESKYNRTGSYKFKFV